jgi:hypothetical protein
MKTHIINKTATTLDEFLAKPDDLTGINLLNKQIGVEGMKALANSFQLTLSFN